MVVSICATRPGVILTAPKRPSERPSGMRAPPERNRIGTTLEAERTSTSTPTGEGKCSKRARHKRGRQEKRRVEVGVALAVNVCEDGRAVVEHGQAPGRALVQAAVVDDEAVA